MAGGFSIDCAHWSVDRPQKDGGIEGFSMIERFSMQGRITIDNAREMRLQLAEAICSQDSRVVVDISQITYMDTSGLATLLEALRIAHQKGKRLILQGIQEQPRFLFEATELDHVLEIEGIGTL